MPPSKADYLALGKADIIISTTMVGALYGFVFALYIFCARLLYLQLEDRDRRRQHLFTLIYMSLALALALSGIVVNALDVQTSYIDHADYPDGGFVYSASVFVNSPVATMGGVTKILFSLMMSGIQIWRLWVIWRASPFSLYIVALPVLSLLTYLGFDAAGLVMLVQSKATERLSNMFKYGGTASQLCISAIVTITIVARIYMVRRRNMEIMDQTDNSNPYTSVISMLIESFALESVWMVVGLSVSAAALNNAAPGIISYIFGRTQPFIQLLAYLLVIYRVTMGRAWKEDTAEKLTTIEWNRDGLQTAQTGTRASISITQDEL